MPSAGFGGTHEQRAMPEWLSSHTRMRDLGARSYRNSVLTPSYREGERAYESSPT